ncbi:MAG: hypothetical protein E7575_07510 [Ruminococcaceae bacterium]|nr:hypothetical protein [Oscillospiraceae bacterium]
MKSIKLIALLLAAMLCLPLLASCAESGPVKNVRPGPGTDIEDVGNFASGDFDGEDFTFLFVQQKAGTKDYYGGNYLDAESLTGDTISDAVYKRNLAVEELYKVKVKQNVQDGAPAELLQSYYMAGDYFFDVIYGWGYKMGALIPENFFASVNNLPHIDLTKPYWSPSAVEDLSINGNLYIFINDISMNSLEWADLLFYNKQVAEDYNVETTYGSPYQLVRDGKWTIDTFLKMVQHVSNDLNGDGKITGTDDVYGILGASSLSFAYASGISTVEKQDDGTYLLSYFNDKTLDIGQKINRVFSNTDHNPDWQSMSDGADMTGYNDPWEYTRSFFAKGHCVFLTGSAQITGEFRDMETPYGILPLPKYDEYQENYYHNITELASLFAIPTTYNQKVSTSGASRTGMILEYMAYKSNQVLLPQYYDTLLKGQRLDSPDDVEMLDIIRASVGYDFCAIMSIVPKDDGTGSDIVTNLTTILESPDSARSKYERVSTKYQKAVNDFYIQVLNNSLKEQKG